MNTLERQLHKNKGTEDFEKEEDLEDWGFVKKALNWWENKAKELRLAADA